MYEKYLEILSESTLFHNIERKDLSTLLNCLKPRILLYKKYDYIAKEGDSFDSIGIILKGEATVSKESLSGSRVVLTLLKKGDVFGEMAAFTSEPCWPATVQTQEASEVFFLNKENIIGECNKMCQWHRTMISNFIRIISKRALMLNKKVEYLTIKSMQGKISTYLLEQYKKTGNRNINLSLNRNELADFLNVSRPSMSREMCKMRDEGIIDFHLSAFRILDLEALKRKSSI